MKKEDKEDKLLTVKIEVMVKPTVGQYEIPTWRAWFDDERGIWRIGSELSARRIFVAVEEWMKENHPEAPTYKLLIIDRRP
tara:strand:- start:6410 stop:6652 length:243 start_codon:yes stop_codon:yes gene_type:complete